MKWKQNVLIAALVSSFLLACGDRNFNQNDGTGEMPEDQTMGTGDEPYIDTAGNVDTIRLDSTQ